MYQNQDHTIADLITRIRALVLISSLETDRLQAIELKRCLSDISRMALTSDQRQLVDWEIKHQKRSTTNQELRAILLEFLKQDSSTV